MKNLNDAVLEALLSDPENNARFGELFRLTSRVFHSPIYFDAPHVIFVDSTEDSEIQANNIGIIITYGRLAAQALGLGTCWNGLSQAAMRMNPELMKMIGIRGKTTGAFVIGYPNITFHRAPPRSSKPVKGLED